MNELARHVDTALAESGYPGRVAAPRHGAHPDTAFSTVGGRVPHELVVKAMQLSALRRKGADAPVRCPQHALAKYEGQCPKYPVGALLAGTIRGCAR